MKQAFSILAAGLALVRAIPQGSNGGLSNLPACGQTCISNMLSVATSSFGCDANNLTQCACCNPDFGFGVRDCSRAVCGGENADYSSVISYGLAYCSTAVGNCPSSTGAGASSVLAGATGSSGSSGASATGSGSGAGATGIGALIAAGVSPVSGASNEYVLGGSTTISAGGNAATISGAQITALPSGSGIDVSAGNFQTTVAASALGAGAAAGAGGLAGLAAAVAAVSGASNEYVVGGSQTISAGGNAATVSGAVFTALPSGGGVDVSSGSAQTTLDAATVSGAGGAGAGAAGLAGLAGAVAAVSGASNEYVVGGSQTISAGGPAATVSGAVFTALPSGGGVDISSGSAMTTLDAATVSGGAGGAGGAGGSMTSSGAGGSMTSSGGSGGESTASGSGAGAGGSSTSSGGMPKMTAAPAFIGAAALAILAL